MKVLKYTICSRINQGTAAQPQWKDLLYPVKMEWSAINEEIVKKEAYNGEYTIEDDGMPEEITTDTVLNTLLGGYI